MQVGPDVSKRALTSRSAPAQIWHVMVKASLHRDNAIVVVFLQAVDHSNSIIEVAPWQDWRPAADHLHE